MIKVVFSEFRIDGAINFPENGLTPINQVLFIKNNLTDNMTIVTVSPFILQAVLSFWKKNFKDAEIKTFLGDKEVTRNEDLIFVNADKAMRALLFDKMELLGV